MFLKLKKILKNNCPVIFLRSKKSKGFTLVETLVAITILLMAIMGPMTLAKQGIVSSRSAKNQVIAFYLAQEAVEQIRNIRDSNLLSTKPWTKTLTICIGGNKCKIDVTDNTLKSCSTSCEKLRRSPEGLYGYNSLWGETKFRRSITITKSPLNSDEISILVEMKWDNDKKGFKIREELFNL